MNMSPAVSSVQFPQSLGVKILREDRAGAVVFVPANTLRTMRHERRTGVEAPLAPVAPRAPRVPQVRYVAKPLRPRLALTEQERRVYRAIARRKQGSTRAQLLAEFKAEVRTGIVDGPLRRLRLKKAITVDHRKAA